MNAVKIKYCTGRKKQAGATLVVIIITMLVVAVVGIALYSITNISTMNQSIAQRAAKAYYLAESGVRVAASEYKASASKNATLVNLHTQTFSLPNNQGQITINIYPYWFYATAADATAYTVGAHSITLHLPGAVPPIDDTGDTTITFPASGLLKIKDSGRPTAWPTDKDTAVSYNAVSAPPYAFDAASGGTPVTFTLPTGFQSSIITGDEFYIGSDSYTTAQTATTPGNALILNVADATAANIFPPQRGTIFVVFAGTFAVSQYSYDSRNMPTASTVRLTNIRPIPGAPYPQFPLTVGSGTQIYVGKSLGFRSASTYGQ